MARQHFERLLDASEIGRCLLCHDAPCTQACPRSVPVHQVLRSLYLDNYLGAAATLEHYDCTDCDAPCEERCVLASGVAPVGIKRSIMAVKAESSQLPARRIEEVDLSCDICGVRLEHPFLLSSSVVASTYDMCARAFETGWAGAAFKTICAFPQHEASPRFSAIKTHSGAFVGFKNIEQLSDHGVHQNMHIFRALRHDFPSKVIVASIMGRDEEEWASLARASERAGASVIECNFSCPNMESGGLGMTIGQSPELVERFTAATRRGTNLPILAKLTPNVTDMVPMALAARRGGADGIAAINTINSITGVDIETLVAEPQVQGKSMVGGYSGTAVKPIALRYISNLANEPGLDGMHISGMGGVGTWVDGLEFLLLGAGSVQVTTAVMQYGYRIITDLVAGLEEYLRYKGIPTIDKLIGAASASVVDNDDIERDLVLLPKFNLARCNGCGRCYLSCRDGGHQAISFSREDGIPHLDTRACVGCHLCRLVCPTDAIGVASKPIRRSS